MDKVLIEIENLIATIKECDAYIKFTAAKEKLKQQPELYAWVNQLRKQNYHLQNDQQGDRWLEQQQQSVMEIREMRKDIIVNDFLENELVLCRMIQRINSELAKSIDFGIEDFADEIKW